MVTKLTKKPTSSSSIVTKSGLADRIKDSKFKNNSLTKAQIEAVINETLEELKKALVKKEEIRFPGYFSFKTFMAKPRIAMNLKTKKKMTIPAKRRVKFSVSNNLKEAVANGK
ncbi:MAG: HU family DNA-binding protein [Spiroplasmataceae bacterium]|jgi:DNA-binding protein HU-beta|nr:HU family DNA-binding protein [Spiroplasmataceae bacterium]